MFNLLKRTDKEKMPEEVIIDKKDAQKETKKINNTIELDMDYVDAIYDTAEYVFKDNDGIASSMSAIAVKVQDNKDAMSEAINKLESVNEKAIGCNKQLRAIVEKNEKREQSTNELLQDFNTSITGFMEETNRRNQLLIDELRKFTEAIVTTSDHIAQLNDITKQVRLISLNARIEAARAGEAGKGFAVVAEEIQKLADQSEYCTKEFTNAINTISNGAERNETLLNESVDNMKNGWEKLASYVSEVKSGVVQDSQSFSNTCETLFSSLSININDNNDITKLMNDLVEVFSENATDIAKMCEMQVMQTSSIYEILDLSKQIRAMKQKSLEITQ